MNHYLERRVGYRLAACVNPEGSKPMAAYWYEQDIQDLMAEVERLDKALKDLAWKAA